MEYTCFCDDLALNMLATRPNISTLNCKSAHMFTKGLSELAHVQVPSARMCTEVTEWGAWAPIPDSIDRQMGLQEPIATLFAQ